MRSPWSATRRDSLLLAGVCGLLAAGLLGYSQTRAYYGDEGFHLLAAQLINAGRRPYADFFYQHVPLYPYTVGFWMRLFGPTWRSAHVLSSLFTFGALLLTAGFAFSRFRGTGWRLGGVFAAALLGFQWLVLQFGTIGQPFGLCLVLTVAAFRLTVAGASRGSVWWGLGAGFCAGAASASSLLAAPAPPILMGWLARWAPRGQRLRRLGLFMCGVLAVWGPLVALAAAAPRRALFSVVTYHLLYREPGFQRWDAQVLASWLDSPQGVLLVLLAGLGLLSLAGADGRQAEFRLCAWLVAGLGLLAALARPTYPQYFLLLLPFAALLASLGMEQIEARPSPAKGPPYATLLVIALLALGVARWLYQGRGPLSRRWPMLEQIAAQLNHVTPAQGMLFATEVLYFAAGRLPPAGLENSYAAELAPEAARSLGFPPWQQVEASVREGRFDTVYLCGAELVERWGLRRLYANHTRHPAVNPAWDCYLFWAKGPSDP